MKPGRWLTNLPRQEARRDRAYMRGKVIGPPRALTVEELEALGLVGVYVRPPKRRARSRRG